MSDFHTAEDRLLTLNEALVWFTFLVGSAVLTYIIR